MFYALATNSDLYKDKLNIFIALAPVTKISHIRVGLLWFISMNHFWVIPTFKLFGFYELFPAGWLTTGAMRLICGTIPLFCNMGAWLVVEEDTDLDDESRLPVYLGHFPSGTSLRTLEHFSQTINNGKFTFFDYEDEEANNRIYG